MLTCVVEISPDVVSTLAGPELSTNENSPRIARPSV